MNKDYSFIEGSDQVVSDLGYWTTFHDAHIDSIDAMLPGSLTLHLTYSDRKVNSEGMRDVHRTCKIVFVDIINLWLDITDDWINDAKFSIATDKLISADITVSDGTGKLSVHCRQVRIDAWEPDLTPHLNKRPPDYTTFKLGWPG